MFRKLFWLQSSIAVLFLCATSVSAESITFEPKIWNKGDSITVTGTDLKGKYVRLRHLCFAPETALDKLTCFGEYDSEKKEWIQDEDFILKWEDTDITFLLPSNLPPKGVLALFRTYDDEKCFGTAGCIDLFDEKRLDIASFTAHPQISEITNVTTGKLAASLTAGQKYKISGDFFGSEKGYILFSQPVNARTGRSYSTWIKLPSNEINFWDHSTILWTPNTGIDLSLGVKVHNTALESAPYTYELQSEAVESATSSSIASSASSPFSDVLKNAAYLDALIWAKESGVISGYSDGTFRPDDAVNRAEYLKMVSLAAKLSTSADGDLSFSDVDAQSWYAPFIRAAQAKGIVKGYSDGTFKPEQAVSYADTNLQFKSD